MIIFFLASLSRYWQLRFTMNRITLRLPDKTLAALQGRASLDGRTSADLARHLLNLALDIPDAPKLPLKKNPKLL